MGHNERRARKIAPMQVAICSTRDVILVCERSGTDSRYWCNARTLRCKAFSDFGLKNDAANSDDNAFLGQCKDSCYIE